MNEDAYRQLDALFLDELLLRAGLAQTSDDPVRFSLDFVVDTDRDAGSVVLKCDRINDSPIELRFPLEQL